MARSNDLPIFLYNRIIWNILKCELSFSVQQQVGKKVFLQEPGLDYLLESITLKKNVIFQASIGRFHLLNMPGISFYIPNSFNCDPPQNKCCEGKKNYSIIYWYFSLPYMYLEKKCIFFSICVNLCRYSRKQNS